MDIDTLPVPDYLKRSYISRGITTLYPPQEECVEKGLFTGENLLVAIPTASGKTLVAEMAMHQHIIREGKCLYIVPLKALASEKLEEFSGKDARVGIATGDFDRRDEYLGRNNIIIATSEKVDSLLRNAARWLREISLLVVDEIHLIDSEDRGPTLEMVITKLRSINPRMQVIALSATIGNPGPLAEWLNARCITSEWRPVDLREGVYHRGTIHFADGDRTVETPSKNDDTNLCLDTVSEGGQCLVFVSSRKNAEGFAKRMAQALKTGEAALAESARRLDNIAETDMGRVLATCVGRGAAFHHAGLTRDQRRIVEQGFRDGHIKVISSTPTLAAGLNLPARRVVIRDYLRFQAGEGMVPIPVMEYRQMAGRAGRPHLDPYGEAVLIARERGSVEELFEAYIEAPSEDIRSRCGSESAITTHILSLIATGFVTTRDELAAFLEQTFYVFQQKRSRHLSRIIDRALGFLVDAEMVTDLDGFLHATRYGTLVSRLYIDPRSAELISGVLHEHGEVSEIGVLQMLCHTPDMYTLFVRKADLGYLEEFAFRHEADLWMEFEYGEMETFFRSLKTAMLLNDWISEVGEATICERYGVGPGDIYNVTEGVMWLVHAAARIAGMETPDLAGAIDELEIRVRHGIKRELLPLVRLRGIGRVRARRLFNNNIRTPADLSEAGVERVTAILGRGVALQLFSQLEGTRPGSPPENGEEEKGEEGGQSSLHQFG